MKITKTLNGKYILKMKRVREKIVKKAKSKRAATILYNKIIKSDDYYEVGMRAIKESKTSNMMRNIRKGGTAGPWTIIVSKNNSIKRTTMVKNLKEIPAYMDDIKKKFPNHKIGIESKGGKIVYREAMDRRQAAETLKQIGGNRFIADDWC